MNVAIEKELNLNKSSWKPVKFGDVVTEPKESTRDIVGDGFQHIVGLEHIETENIHLKRWMEVGGETTFSKVFRKGDVLFGRRRAYLKKAALANFDGVCSGDITVFRTKSNLIPELLPFIVNNERFFDYAIKHSAGGLSPRVKFKDLANFEFLLPPKEEQKKLAELLWAMDEVVEKEKSLLSNIEKLYFSKRKQIGKSGKSYKLKEIINLNYGKPLKNSDRINGEYDVISSAGFQGKHNLFISEGPGIVIGRKGNAGNVMLVENNFWTIDTAYYVSLSKKFTNIPMKGLYHILKNVDFKRDVTATAVPGLNREDALNRTVLIPENKELLSFISDFEKLTNTENLILKKISFSQSLQKSLINQIF